MVEEQKGSVGESKCVCQHMTACESGIHRFCFRRCCMWKCIAVAIVIVLAFGAGRMSGREHGDRFEHGYRGGHMMGNMMMRGEEEGQSEGYDYGAEGMPYGKQQVVIYRTIPAQTSSTTTTVTAPVMMTK